MAANRRIRFGLARLLFVATGLAAMTANAVAQTSYPNRTVKIVVPAPPGANLDTIPRIIADKLSSQWGHPVIIEHRPGAAQNLGAEVVARSEPDGYTLLATPQGPLVISQHFFAKLGFDPAAFAPVSIIASQPLVLIAHPKFRASSLKELVASAKTTKISFASAGTGSSPHLTGEMLKLAAKIDFVHVPYKGLAPAMTDLLGGHVDMMFDNLTNALPQISDGKVKALAVAGQARIPELPDVPAIAEMFPGFYSTSWFAIVAPPKTPPEVTAKISQAIAGTLKLPDVVEPGTCKHPGRVDTRRNGGLPEKGIRPVAAGDRSRRDQAGVSMIPKSGSRFSDKIMLNHEAKRDCRK